jgi:dihydroneopterin aldolase
MRIQARVGVGDDERAQPQELVVDVELHLDLTRAGQADELSATVDYEEVCALVKALPEGRSFKLIEAVAHAIAVSTLERFHVVEVRVSVRKPGALAAWGVPFACVEVRRRRDA